MEHLSFGRLKWLCCRNCLPPSSAVTVCVPQLSQQTQKPEQSTHPQLPSDSPPPRPQQKQARGAGVGVEGCSGLSKMYSEKLDLRVGHLKENFQPHMGSVPGLLSCVWTSAVQMRSEKKSPRVRDASHDSGNSWHLSITYCVQGSLLIFFWFVFF